MKARKRLLTPVLVLQWILIAASYSNTLSVNEQGDVFAETDRYLARFEYGVLVHFHNKLTQETYTQGRSNASTLIKVGNDGFLAYGVDPEIRRLSPLEYRLTYRRNDTILRLFIGIDAQTGDILIRQIGVAPGGHLERIMWGVGNLSHRTVDLILPVSGGQRFTGKDISRKFDYPEIWETQLAVLQGQRGGIFIRSEDTQYQFKTLEYSSKDGDFYLNFWSIPLAPFDHRTRVETSTWRLNAYRGDWQVPALEYREWMDTGFQPPDRNAWLEDIECIIKDHGALDVEKLRHLNRLVDAPKTLIYLVEWRDAGYDLYLPDYTPKKDFGHFIAEAQRYGFKVMVHTTMNGVSENHPLYGELEKYQVRHPWTGEKDGYLWEDPTNPRRFAYINPASRLFREVLVSALKRLCETYPIDALHLDISSRTPNVVNGVIDGLTMAEGNILLHQEIKDAIPGIVLGGEGLHEVTFLHESFAQRYHIPETEQPHPISSFLFSPYTKLYGHLGLDNPDDEPARYKEFLYGYEVWGVLPTITIRTTSDLSSDRVETHKLFERVRKRQNWTFGDVNGDSVVNVLDLVFVAQSIGTQRPINQHVDANKDGTVDVLDLVLIAKQIE